jgi:hypothetical protein
VGDMEKSIKIFESFIEQDQNDIIYWKKISGEQKLEILEAIRAQYWALYNEHPGRLLRVYRIIERTKHDT